jgi:hypothetical protein
MSVLWEKAAWLMPGRLSCCRLTIEVAAERWFLHHLRWLDICRPRRITLAAG